MSIDEERLQELAWLIWRRLRVDSISPYKYITESHRINYTGEALLDH